MCVARQVRENECVFVTEGLFVTASWTDWREIGYINIVKLVARVSVHTLAVALIKVSNFSKHHKATTNAQLLNPCSYLILTIRNTTM